MVFGGKMGVLGGGFLPGLSSRIFVIFAVIYNFELESVEYYC
jgi:hypothetical protein